MLYWNCTYTRKVRTPLPRVTVLQASEEDALFLGRLLQAGGWVAPPQVFSTVAVALEHLRGALTDAALAPTVIFLEADVAGQSGFDVVKWMRQQPVFNATVIVLLAGAGEPRNLGKASQLGVDALIVKFPSPSEMRELIPAICRATTQPLPRPPLAVGCNLLRAS